MPEDDVFFAHRPTPYLITRRWVYEVAQRYGTHSAYWQARVRGEDETVLTVRRGACVVFQKSWVGERSSGHVLNKLA
jgi:hypothetical protein